jgi:hypothetical protein
VKNAVIGIAAVAGLAAAASAQTFTLGAGQLQYRIVADNTLVTTAPGDNVVQLALQVRYTGGDVRVASLGATRGRIASNEADSAGVLARASVRQAPYGNNDFGVLARQGVTEGHRELFAGGSSNNNADQNGGNPASSTAGNPNNGGGEFRFAPGLAGFGNILAFDNATTGVGRPDGSGDGLLISVGLIDNNNGTDGDGSGIEPTAGLVGDQARWDTIFLFTYTVTNFAGRTISFDYQNLGSAANPGVTEDTVQWWDAALGNFRGSNAAAGTFRDDLSDNIQVVPAPGAVALLGLGGLVAGRRRRA